MTMRQQYRQHRLHADHLIRFESRQSDYQLDLSNARQSDYQLDLLNARQSLKAACLNSSACVVMYSGQLEASSTEIAQEYNYNTN